MRHKDITHAAVHNIAVKCITQHTFQTYGGKDTF